MKADYEDENRQQEEIIKQHNEIPNSTESIPSQNTIENAGHTIYDEEYQYINENQINKQLSEEYKVKRLQAMKQIQQFIEGFKKAVVEFKEDQQNIFRIVNPYPDQISFIVKMWLQRPIYSDKYILTLVFQQCRLDVKSIQKLFEIYPSIQIICNGEKIDRKGVLKVKDGVYFEGIQKHMLIIKKDDFVYRGEVQNDLPHGVGHYTNFDKKGGYEYNGQFQNGERHGRGVMVNALSKYQGQFKNDYKDGEGYQETFKSSKKVVPGKPPKFKRISVYKGQYKEGHRHGKGIEQTSHGVYDGEWKDDAKNGEGQMKYKNGDYYKGNWERGEFSGSGQYCQKDNCTYVGDFKNGFYHGNGRMEYSNGDVYEGEFQFNKKHGQGKYDYEDGDYYDGQWKLDSADGQGTSMMGDDFFVGQFKNGKKHGQGQLTNADGDVTHGIWENNQLVKTLDINGEPVEEE